MRSMLKKMGTPIDDACLMMHIMNNLPSTYDSLIENLENRLHNTMDSLTVSVLRDKLSEKNKKIRIRKGFKSNESDNSEEDKEMSMSIKTFMMQMLMLQTSEI